MGGAVIAVLMLGVVLIIFVVNLFQNGRRQMLENEDMRRIESRKKQAEEIKKENQRLTIELSSTERKEREQVRASNPVLEVSDLIGEHGRISALTGLSREKAVLEFYDKYKRINVYDNHPNDINNKGPGFSYKSAHKGHLEYIENNFHVKGAVVEKTFGVVQAPIWLSDEEYKKINKEHGYTYGFYSGSAWEVIVDIGKGVFVAILCQFPDTESEEALQKSAVFENLAIGTLIEATGILSIPNQNSTFTLGVRPKSYNRDCVYYSGIFTVRAPLSAITIHA